MARVFISVMFILLRFASAKIDPFDGGTLPESIKSLLKSAYANAGVPLSRHPTDVSIPGTQLSQGQDQFVQLKPLSPIQGAILKGLKEIWDSTAKAEDSIYKKQIQTVLEKVANFVYSREPLRDNEPDETLDRIWNVLIELRNRLGVTNPSQFSPNQIQPFTLKPTHEEAMETMDEKQVSSIFTTLKSAIADHYSRQIGEGVGEVENVPISAHDNLISSNYQNLVLSKLYQHYDNRDHYPERDETLSDKTMEKIAAVRDSISPLFHLNSIKRTTQKPSAYPATTGLPLKPPQPQAILDASLRMPDMIRDNFQDQDLHHKIRVPMPSFQDDSQPVHKNSAEKLANSIVQILYQQQSENNNAYENSITVPQLVFPTQQQFIPDEGSSTQKLNLDQSTSKSLLNSYVPVQLMPTFGPQVETTQRMSNTSPYETNNNFMTENPFLKQALTQAALQNQLQKPILTHDIVRDDNSTQLLNWNPTEIESGIDYDIASTPSASGSLPVRIQVMENNAVSLGQTPTVIYNGSPSRLGAFIAKLMGLSFGTKLVMFLSLLISVMSVGLGAMGAVGPAVLALGMLGFMIPITILVLSPDNRGRHGRLGENKHRREHIVSEYDDIIEILQEAAKKYNREIQGVGDSYY